MEKKNTKINLNNKFKKLEKITNIEQYIIGGENIMIK